MRHFRGAHAHLLAAGGHDDAGVLDRAERLFQLRDHLLEDAPKLGDFVPRRGLRARGGVLKMRVNRPQFALRQLRHQRRQFAERTNQDAA